MWERFFNWQSDMDWTWGPMLPLRPPPDTPIRPWVWVRLFLVCTALGLLFLALCAALCVLLPRFASARHLSLPLPVAETLSTLQAMVTDPGTRLLLVGLLLSLPPLFFAFCLPYHWAWNKRAAWLRQSGVPEIVVARADVWPPAPKEAPTPCPSPASESGVRVGRLT